MTSIVVCVLSKVRKRNGKVDILILDSFLDLVNSMDYFTKATEKARGCREFYRQEVDTEDAYEKYAEEQELDEVNDKTAIDEVNGNKTPQRTSSTRRT